MRWSQNQNHVRQGIMGQVSWLDVSWSWFTSMVSVLVGDAIAVVFIDMLLRFRTKATEMLNTNKFKDVIIFLNILALCFIMA